MNIKIKIKETISIPDVVSDDLYKEAKENKFKIEKQILILTAPFVIVYLIAAFTPQLHGDFMNYLVMMTMVMSATGDITLYRKRRPYVELIHKHFEQENTKIVQTKK